MKYKNKYKIVKGVKSTYEKDLNFDIYSHINTFYGKYFKYKVFFPFFKIDKNIWKMVFFNHTVTAAISSFVTGTNNKVTVLIPLRFLIPLSKFAHINFVSSFFKYINFSLTYYFKSFAFIFFVCINQKKVKKNSIFIDVSTKSYSNTLEKNNNNYLNMLYKLSKIDKNTPIYTKNKINNIPNCEYFCKYPKISVLKNIIFVTGSLFYLVILPIFCIIWGFHNFIIGIEYIKCFRIWLTDKSLFPKEYYYQYTTVMPLYTNMLEKKGVQCWSFIYSSNVFTTRSDPGYWYLENNPWKNVICLDKEIKNIFKNIENFLFVENLSPYEGKISNEKYDVFLFLSGLLKYKDIINYNSTVFRNYLEKIRFINSLINFCENNNLKLGIKLKRSPLNETKLLQNYLQDNNKYFVDNEISVESIVKNSKLIIGETFSSTCCVAENLGVNYLYYSTHSQYKSHFVPRRNKYICYNEDELYKKIKQNLNISD